MGCQLWCRNRKILLKNIKCEYQVLSLWKQMKGEIFMTCTAGNHQGAIKLSASLVHFYLVNFLKSGNWSRWTSTGPLCVKSANCSMWGNHGPTFTSCHSDQHIIFISIGPFSVRTFQTAIFCTTNRLLKLFGFVRLKKTYKQLCVPKCKYKRQKCE